MENPINQFGIDLYGTYTDRFKNKLEKYLDTNFPDQKKNILKIDSIIQSDYLIKHRGKRRFKSNLEQSEIVEYRRLLTQMIETGDSEDFFTKSIENRILLGESLLSANLFFREKVMAENINWIMNHINEKDKVVIWAADIHISKFQKKTVKDGDRSMIERLPNHLKDVTYSLSLIPVSSAPKKIRKKLDKRKERFYHYNLSELKEYIKREDEFDGMIICKKVESIENYKVD